MNLFNESDFYLSGLLQVVIKKAQALACAFSEFYYSLSTLSSIRPRSRT